MDKVFEAVLNQIPDTYEHKPAIRKSFGFVLESAAYTPPESMSRMWGMAAGALSTGMIDAHQDKLWWAERVRQIFNAELNYEDFLERT